MIFAPDGLFIDRKIVSSSASLKIEYFGALDGFRGVLAICVAIYHTFWFSNINSSAFFENGPVIIDLFFVFSGFLLYHLYGHRLSNEEEAAVFLKRRFARLYPIHLFMLGVFLLFSFARIYAHKFGLTVQEVGEILPFEPGSTENLWSLLSNLTLTHAMGMHDALTFNPPSWTISVEMFAYFVFLLMFLRMPPTKASHFALITIAIAAIYWVLSCLKPNMDITYDLAFWRCLAGFYTGVVASWLYTKFKPKVEQSKLSREIPATILEVFSLSAFVAFVIYMPGKLQFFVAPFAFLFVVVFAFQKGWISRFMSLSPFRYFAKISYSVYMTHTIFAIVFNIFGSRLFPILYEANNGWAGDFFLVPYLISVVIFSHLTWRYIERPGQKLIQNLDFSIFPKLKPKLST